MDIGSILTVRTKHTVRSTEVKEEPVFDDVRFKEAQERFHAPDKKRKRGSEPSSSRSPSPPPKATRGRTKMKEHRSSSVEADKQRVNPLRKEKRDRSAKQKSAEDRLAIDLSTPSRGGPSEERMAVDSASIRADLKTLTEQSQRHRDLPSLLQRTMCLESLEVHVAALESKLSRDPSAPWAVQTPRTVPPLQRGGRRQHISGPHLTPEEVRSFLRRPTGDEPACAKGDKCKCMYPDIEGDCNELFVGRSMLFDGDDPRSLHFSNRPCPLCSWWQVEVHMCNVSLLRPLQECTACPQDHFVSCGPGAFAPEACTLPGDPDYPVVFEAFPRVCTDLLKRTRGLDGVPCIDIQGMLFRETGRRIPSTAPIRSIP